MHFTLAHIGAARASSSHYDSLIRIYLERASTYVPTQTQAFPSEQAFLAWLARPKQGKSSTLPVLPVLLDSRGRALSSIEFAAWLGARRDQATQHIAFAIGPADGWSPAALELVQSRSGLLLSLGPITMAHSLARLVLAEQLYRACTILSGHPYHSGH